jgi:hypothetical protein
MYLHEKKYTIISKGIKYKIFEHYFENGNNLFSIYTDNENYLFDKKEEYEEFLEYLGIRIPKN